MTSIYLAGKVGMNDWRHSLVRDLRGYWGSDGEAPSLEWPVLPKGVLGIFDYVGPYFMSDDHGCGHGQNTHGCGYDRYGMCGGAYPTPGREAVRDLCLAAIDHADIVFAWLDDPSAYGTLVEVGYARGLGKRTVVAAPKLPAPSEWMPPREMLSWQDYAGDGAAAPSRQITDDLWFAFACGMPICAETPTEAIKQLAATVVDLDSPIEKRFWEAHLRGRHVALSGLRSQVSALAGKYRIDFALPRLKVGIELDGYTWHSSKEAFTKDRQRQRDLEADGWRLIRFSGAEVNGDVEACVRQAAEQVARLKDRS